MTELLVGTKKGLFVLDGDSSTGFEVTARAFPGQSVEYAMRDPRSGRYLASVTSWFYGGRIWVTDDPAGEWQEAEGTALPEDGDASLAKIWVIAAGEADGVLYAGGEPGLPLREPRRREHLVAQPRALGPPHPARLDSRRRRALPAHDRAVARRSEPADGRDLRGRRLALRRRGATWRYSNGGIEAEYLPEEARDAPIGYCVHNVRRAGGNPERLFMQFHGGIYRSDDAGGSWVNIGDGTDLPSDFGFPIVVDPADPDSAYVIPLVGAEDRTTPGGSVRVWETRDAGATWTPRGNGLPERDAYLTVLREAFDTSGSGADLELYFGATSGDVFGSGDAGATWAPVAAHLPPVQSVRTA